MANRPLGDRLTVDGDIPSFRHEDMVVTVSTNRGVMGSDLRITADEHLEQFLTPHPHHRTVQKDLPTFVASGSDPEHR